MRVPFGGVGASDGGFGDDGGGGGGGLGFDPCGPDWCFIDAGTRDGLMEIHSAAVWRSTHVG